MEKYVHYGHKTFDKRLFANISNCLLGVKPEGGFWASNVNAKFDWEDWLKLNEHQEIVDGDKFIFTLSEEAKILRINSIEDLEELPQIKYKFIPSWTMLDFEKLATMYDAIEINISNDPKLYFTLYTWDCDSILIMNPDIIQQVNL